jgi:DNA invertase Pin-like site-specific DNA recombinase
MIYAYCRVSSNLQDNINQEHTIKEFAKKGSFAIDKWVNETISSKKDLRTRKITQLLRELQEGDEIYITELSRFARSIFELNEIMGKIFAKKVKIIVIKQGLELKNDIQGKTIIFAFGLAAEIERQMISERTKQGIAVQIENGKHWGRKKGQMGMSKLTKHKSEILEMIEEGKGLAQISNHLNCSSPCLRNFLKQQNLPQPFKPWEYVTYQLEKNKLQIQNNLNEDSDAELKKLAVKYNMTKENLKVYLKKIGIVWRVKNDK